MAYDGELAERVRDLLQAEQASEKAMFGGLAFLVGGHMAVAVSGRGGLMVRTDPDETAVLVTEPHVERMVMKGRSMDGWLLVDGAGLVEDDALARWVEHGAAFVRTLPAKDPGR